MSAKAWIAGVVLYSLFALIGNWHRRRRFRQWWAAQSEELQAEIEKLDPGWVETAFPMKAAKGGRYVQNQVRNGYMASSVPPAMVGAGAVVGACVTWVAGACTDVAWSTVGWTTHGVTPSDAARSIRQGKVN